MRSRIATLLAAGALVAAAGGTFAVAGPDGGGESQSAAVAQYKPAKDCSDKKNETAAAKACKPKQGVKGARAKKRGYRLVIKKGVVIRVYPDGRRVVQRKGGKAKQGAQAEKQGS